MMNPKRVLAAVFALELNGKRVDAESLSTRLGLTKAEASSEIGRLSSSGLLRGVKTGASLTRRGRDSIKVVFIGGGFEIIHLGHVHTISEAKKLGDVLVVSVARDSTIRRRKKREPVVGERERVRLLSALRDVDAAILGVKGDIYVTLERVAPDVVALGYDQHHLEEDIRREARARGLKLRVVRLHSPVPDVKTTRLLNEL